MIFTHVVVITHKSTNEELPEEISRLIRVNDREPLDVKISTKSGEVLLECSGRVQIEVYEYLSKEEMEARYLKCLKNDGVDRRRR